MLHACAPAPPRQQHDLCAIFDQHPAWYDYARASEEKWGVPAHILMAFVRHESAYRHDARPPYEWFWIIPLGRPSSAAGYGQVQDPAWQDYTRENGGFLKSRSDMADVLDFIGWYNNKSHDLLGIPVWDSKSLYLAYHEGHTGYRRGSYRDDPSLIRYAEEVDWTAREYGAQLRDCDDRFRCRKWYQFWPFCG